jgi:hypothetical protein
VSAVRAARRASAFAAPFLLLAAGCSWTSERPVQDLPATEPVETSEAAVEPPPPMPSAAEPGVSLLPGPSVTIDQVTGTTPETAGAIFAEASERMERCSGVGGGVMKVRLESEGASVKFSVEPGTTVAENARECVLKSLSTAELDDILTPSTSPSERTPGMQSVLTIQW